jgi:hypothetical protein
MCTVLLPPAGYPIAVNNIYHINIIYFYMQQRFQDIAISLQAQLCPFFLFLSCGQPDDGHAGTKHLTDL